MIINTGGRTDTVNYYTPWLLNRFKQGYVYSRNPLFPNHITKYKLDPSVVDCVVFCSKNYQPILSYFHRISDRFNIFCHYTITAYDKDVELEVPPIDESIETLKQLSAIAGKEKIAWRYDPVLLTEKYTVDYHLQMFEYMTAKLAPYIEFCIFSFVEMYKRLEWNMPEIILLTDADKQILAKGMGKIAAKYKMRLQTCGTIEEYTQYGIQQSGCMTTEILGNALGCQFKQMAHKGTRIGCRCMPTRDIGAYDTCLNGCKYCYANKRPELATENFKLHDPDSPLLIGYPKDTDIIKDASQQTFIMPKSLF